MTLSTLYLSALLFPGQNVEGSQEKRHSSFPGAGIDVCGEENACVVRRMTSIMAGVGEAFLPVARIIYVSRLNRENQRSKDIPPSRLVVFREKRREE